MKLRLYITFLLSSIILISSGIQQKDDLEEIRKRVISELLKHEVDDDKVSEILITILEGGSWPNINYDDVSREGFDHRNHLKNMLDMARAYKSKSSDFYRKKKVKKAIELALNYWVEHDFICENWWYNQIGVPNDLVTLLLIMDEELSKHLVDGIQPILDRATVNASGARPGGDRIKIAGIQAKNLLFLRDTEKFEEIIRIIEGEIKFVESVSDLYGYGYATLQGGLGTGNTSGRGLQYDFSFHHRTDAVNNTISYGLGYANVFIEWAHYVANTTFAFSDEKLNLLVDYYLDGICKTAVYGKYPDPGAKNRSISRRGTLNPYNSRDVEKLVASTSYRKDELHEIADIRNNTGSITTSFAKFFWKSDHFTFQRPNFFTSVRMYSTRVNNMEWPYNSEGLLNHHRGDGTNHISVSGTEYFDIAPVFDYQKIPGATIVQKDALPGPAEVQKLGLTDFVGAVSDGMYGAVAFDFKSSHDPLIARKSWFFFDNEYVCLGAGISAKTDFSVATTLNQCLLQGDVTISQNNEVIELENGEKKLDNVEWVFHDNIGYVFPEPQKISILNSEQTGSWWRINKQSDSPKGEVKMDVFKLWIDHEKRPSDESYQYIVVPATDLVKLKAASSKNNIEILSNNSDAQAVGNRDLGIYQMVFYKAGAIQLKPELNIKCDNPGIVMVRLRGDEVVAISVADPNRELSKMHLSVRTKISEDGKGYTAHWDEEKKLSYISIELPQGQNEGSSATVLLD